MALHQFAEGIWTCDSEMKMFGIEVGTRMTIIDIDGRGNLFVHSPIRLNQNIKEELQKIGEVKYVVAPNKWHHLFIQNFKNEYPNAQFYCAPGLEVKKSDFLFNAVIKPGQNFPWNKRLQHLIIDGCPEFNEVVFFDAQTKSLLVTDLALHICESDSWLTRFAFSLMGSYKKFGWSKFEKLLFIRNKKEFHSSIEQVLKFDFEQVLLTHGTPVTSGGKDYLRAAFS